MTVIIRDLTQADLKDSNLTVLNDVLRQYGQALNQSQAGNRSMTGPLDMGGHPIHNVGTATGDTDALTQKTADVLYANKTATQAGQSSTSMSLNDLATNQNYMNTQLQLTRRLNDKTQQEQYTSFLNRVMSTPPHSNDSAMAYVDNGDNTVTVTVPAGNQQQADGTLFPYAGRTDTFTKPAQINYYYYAYSFANANLALLGPYAGDNSTNRLNASTDGFGFIGTVAVPATGTTTGAGAAGGGGFSGPSGSSLRGCCEINTPVEYYPGTTKVTEHITPCDEWQELVLANGTSVSLAPDTLVSVFKQVQDIDPGDMVEVATGAWVKAKAVIHSTRPSYKVVRKVAPHSTYLANGIRVHNVKL